MFKEVFLFSFMDNAEEFNNIVMDFITAGK
jgi:hypothetical protein